MNFDQSNMTLCEKEIGVVSTSTSFIPQIFRFFEKGRPEVSLMFGRISTVYNLACSQSYPLKQFIQLQSAIEG